MNSGPVPFGYKTGWLAVSSHDPKAVAEHLPVQQLQESDWGAALDAVHRDPSGQHVFITPAVGGWVLVVGPWAIGTGEPTSVHQLAGLVARLSAVFGAAQAFATDRVVEYHHWIRARDGRVERTMAYLGESGEVLVNEGERTPAERSLSWFASPVSEWMPDEDDVLSVAGAWSIDPTSLDSDTPTEGPGYLAGILPGEH